ncbi:glucokinase [Neosynechococcus sphagnicola]|uniref:glucokinase n=1 Tax=Neosynechococcus sphagnicola TaxID=1501145 RepID=UPI000A447BF7|nr:glucokinase [Neosynechococcus sphagnicola]
MTLLLAGDIGGTKTILSLVEAQLPAASTQIHIQTRYEQRFSSPEFFDLVPMVRQFLDAAIPSLGTQPLPETACFAIAGPVVNNTSKVTNLGWSLEADRLERELGIRHISLINDFAAVGYGVLGLTPTDLCTLQAGTPRSDAPIAVIGAGTGLGEGFLIPHPEGHQVFSSEGGSC